MTRDDFINSVVTISIIMQSILYIPYFESPYLFSKYYYKKNNKYLKKIINIIIKMAMYMSKKF